MIGTNLSHYRIIDKLGQGGMGVVYKAEDTKLDRTVAIKVLPSAALASNDDRERFYREAKSAAALNHPHIAQVYEIDEAVPSDAPHGTEPSPFIAMEFIDGQPLDEHLKDKPLKLPQAVALAMQIGQALEAAHEKNIVHRDIKAANVMLTSKGQAKVLDFGLAKTTHSTMLTRMGSTLGTVAYMSPEQARGEEVDHRTDLWALGVVLYELVSGKNPFGGDYEQAVVYSILNEAPEPLTAVRTGVPMQLEWIVEKCLAKSADDRYQSAKDLIVDLRKVDIASASGSKSVSNLSTPHLSSSYHPSSQAHSAHQTSGTPAKQPWLLVAAAVVIGSLLTWGLLSATSAPPSSAPLIRVDIALPSLSFVRFPTMSPTHDYLAVMALGDDGNKGIYLRHMRDGTIQYVRGSEGAGDREMGFSPDGTRLAYNASTNNGLFVVDVPSGIPARITEFGRFAYWESDETLVMTDDAQGGARSYRVSLDSPEPQVMEEDSTKIPEGYNNVLKTNMPGSKWAFGHQLVRVQGGNQDTAHPANVYALNSRNGEVNVIAQNAINPHFVDPDILLYQIGDDNGQLVVRPLDSSNGEFDGQPKDVLENAVAWGDYSVSPGGDLLYFSHGAQAMLANRLWSVDLNEKVATQLLPDLPDNAFPEDPAVSPDRNLLAYGMQVGLTNPNIHLLNLSTNVSQQLTFEHSNFVPNFSADGLWLHWSRMIDGEASTMRQPVDLSAPAEVFIEGGAGARFSPDGRWVAYSRGVRGRMTLVLRNLQSGDEMVVDSTSAFPFPRSFSPDGRYLSYSQDLTAQSSLRVSSTDGRESYTLPGMRGFDSVFLDDGETMLVSAPRSIYKLPIRISPSFGITGPQELLLSTPYLDGFDPGGTDQIFVSSGGVQLSGSESTMANLIWLQNWSDHLNREFDR